MRSGEKISIKKIKLNRQSCLMIKNNGIEFYDQENQFFLELNLEENMEFLRLKFY